MNDQRAVERFAQAIDPYVRAVVLKEKRGVRYPGANVRLFVHNGTPAAGCRLTGEKAEIAARALYREMVNTDKGDQLELQWELCQLPRETLKKFPEILPRV